jgi:outer membrane protein assembly factor BamA
VAFISYFKGEYRLQTIEAVEPLKEVEQEVLAASDELLDYQPDVVHQVVAENKRKKKTFEKLFLEGRPPLNVGVTSSGDFFGGSQVALADVLGDHNFVITAVSLREFRSYDGTYLNLSRRFHYGFSLFDNTRFFFPQFLVPQNAFSRDGAFATQRYTGAFLVGQYPLDKFRRLELQVGALRQNAHYEDPVVQAEIDRRAAEAGVSNPLNNGTIMPISLALVSETTRFREFGPLSGHTYRLGATYAPNLGGSLGRVTLDGDVRKYLRIGSGTLLAARLRGFRSTGNDPDFFYFGGNMELRGYQYLSFAGNEGFFANLEFRFPVIDIMKTPLGILGPVRGTLYAGIGGSHFQGEQFDFGTSDPGVSYVNNPIFGEPVTGYRLVDGRASYGIGLQFFFLGYPLHFDWTRLTDLQRSSPWKFDFWVGFDF